MNEILVKQQREINDVCLDIESMLFPMAWNKPKALKMLNETSKLRKEKFGDVKPAQDRIDW